MTNRTDTVTSQANYDHFQKVFCEIPETTEVPVIASIAITNNQQDFSEVVSLLVHNSICWNCNLTTGCVKKVSLRENVTVFLCRCKPSGFNSTGRVSVEDVILLQDFGIESYLVL